MTDSQTSQGTDNPSADGAEAPTPPGGPLRQDASAGRVTGGHDDDASASETNDKHASESGGDTIPIEDEQSHPEPSSEGHDLQEENAETSLDQPSEG